jgi:Uma2 family endonuclease
MSAPTPTAKKLMTADEFWDYCQLPENEHKPLELVRGEVIELPSPKKIHGVVCYNIARRIGDFVERVRKGYLTTNGSGVQLEHDPDTVRGPDVAYFTDADKFADLDPGWGEVPPVLAVEVLSPSDKQRKVMEKIGDYLRNGVSVVWLVNFEERFVTVFRRSEPPKTVDELQELTADELPGFSCRVTDFFRLPGDQPPDLTSPPS